MNTLIGGEKMSDSKKSEQIGKEIHQAEKTDTAGMLNFIRQGTQMGRHIGSAGKNTRSRFPAGIETAAERI